MACAWTQIDLVIGRADDVLLLGEIKFTKELFSIDKTYALNLKNKIEFFCKNYKTKKNVQLLLIASSGLKDSIWSEELVEHILTAKDLM